MKKILLVDDNVERVKEIFGKIYKMIWKKKGEEGIAAEVIFFGDQFKTRKEGSELQQKDVDAVNRYIKNMLIAHCRDEEQWNSDGEMYREKKELIKNFAKHMCISGNTELEKLIGRWRDKGQLGETERLEEIDFGPLINPILEGGNSEGMSLYILLDVILLFDDIKQIGEGMPIISMGLYNAFKKMNYNCFLYSSYAYDYLLMENYKEIYQKRYNEEIDVYHSNDFFSNEIVSENCLFYHLSEEKSK